MERDEFRYKYRKKGWSEEDIKKTEAIMFKGRDSYYSHQTTMVYWVGLLIAMIGDFLIAVLLVPVLVFMTNAFIYLVIGVAALTFGFIFDFIIRETRVKGKTIIVEEVFVPVLALITIFVTLFLTNAWIVATNDTVHPHYFSIGATYVVAFCIPYALFKTKEVRENWRKQAAEERHHEAEEHLSDTFKHLKQYNQKDLPEKKKKEFYDRLAKKGLK